MWKKLTVLLMAFALVFATAAPSFVDAKGFKAPKRSFNSNTNKSNVTNNSNTTNTTKTPAANKPATSGFGGGGFLKGMMVGGLAGMLFGGLFGGMGFMGEILGLMINVLAIFVLIFLVVKIIQVFTNRRKPDDQKRY